MIGPRLERLQAATIEGDLVAAFERSGGGLLSMGAAVETVPVPASGRAMFLQVRSAVLGRRRLRAAGG